MSNKASKGAVLIVDDEPRNLNILEELLDGYDIRTASDGFSALNVLKNFPVDMVLLDIMMPGMDGYEVCRKIREDPKLRFVKVLLISGRAMIKERLAGYKAGADDYITKPFSLDELMAKIGVFMRLKNIEEIDSLRIKLLDVLVHEAKCSLDSILDFSNLFLSSGELNSVRVLEHSSAIRDRGESFLRLVNVVMLLCELKSLSTPKWEDFEVQVVMANVLKKVGSSTLDIDGSNNVKPAILRGECDLLARSVYALLMSVRAYSEHSSIVAIEGEPCGNKYCLSLTCSNHYPPEVLCKAFEEFAVSDVRYNDGNCVIGLKVAKLAAERVGGGFEVSNESEQGTVFRLVLPLAC